MDLEQENKKSDEHKSLLRFEQPTKNPRQSFNTLRCFSYNSKTYNEKKKYMHTHKCTQTHTHTCEKKKKRRKIFSWSKVDYERYNIGMYTLNIKHFFFHAMELNVFLNFCFIKVCFLFT